MDKRAAFRFPTNVEAGCRSCDRSWETRLVNISTTGCMIAAPGERFPEGALLRLRVKGLTAIDGEIVWQHRSHAGIKFKVPLHPAVMEHLAFQGVEHGFESAPRAPQVAATVEPIRAATRLHSQLIKRTPIAEQEAEPLRASAG